MPSKYDYDFIIVGAGCSGLSLAINLHNHQLLKNKKLLLLESRHQYSQDKSWCSWNTRPHAFEQCVSKRWSKWLVRYNNQDVVQSSNHYCYQYIPAKRFYDYCLSVIDGNPQIELQLGVNTKAIVDNRVITDQGEVRAQQVFDARPCQADKIDFTTAKPYLLQCFHGWHIKTEQPIFDPGQATLMDFPTDQSHGIHFIYLLPFSPHEALIEPTYFLHHTTIPSKQHFYQLARTYLDREYLCQDFSILAHETGVLPMMQMKTPSSSPSSLAIGTAAGLLRPATGYAFHGIQRSIARLIRQLQQGDNPFTQPHYSTLSTWMDTIFLRVCRSNPQQAASIFYALFKHTDPHATVRFLSDESKITDIIKIVSSVPTKPFLRAACFR